MRLRLLGDKKANKTENMVEIVFLRGVSEIQCLVYQQDNVNPFEICNNWIQSATSALETRVVSRGQKTRNADTLLQLLYLINR